MIRLVYDTSMSLDGFITGPDPGRAGPWAEEATGCTSGCPGSPISVAGSGVLAVPRTLTPRSCDELHRRTGAIVIGRTMFDVGEEPWGPDPPFAMPVFIVTHRQQSPITKEGGTTYTFVSDGIEAALDRARAAAGGKDVLVVGGANVARQYLEAGLLDEIHVHIVPILLGGGARLFEGVGQLGLQPTRSIESAAVIHLSYTVMT